MIQAMVLLTLVYKKQGNIDKTFETLSLALTLAETGGWIRPFVELGSPMKGLLLQLQKQNISSVFVEQLVASFQDNSQRAVTELDEDQSSALTQPVSPLVSLTSREKEILELLVQGHANKDIAARLFVSIDTVKTHLRNIYGKLDVKSRLQAVAKTKELSSSNIINEETENSKPI
jgi:LuxR family maltose regulon positive regulatory protein